jgi:PadR family transcriptional regulator PadR
VAGAAFKSGLTLYLYICRVGAMKIRLSSQTLTVLEALLAAPSRWSYGYDISRTTGLKSGTLYPILMRLAEHKLLQTSWETVEPGRPPRHLYRLTPDGLRFARENTREPKRARAGPRVAFGGAKA